MLLKFLLYFDSVVHEKSWSEGSECGGLIPDEGCYEELSFHLAPAHPSLLKAAAAPDLVRFPNPLAFGRASEAGNLTTPDQDHNNVN